MDDGFPPVARNIKGTRIGLLRGYLKNVDNNLEC